MASDKQPVRYPYQPQIMPAAILPETKAVIEALKRGERSTIKPPKK